MMVITVISVPYAIANRDEKENYLTCHAILIHAKVLSSVSVLLPPFSGILRQ